LGKFVDTFAKVKVGEVEKFHAVGLLCCVILRFLCFYCSVLLSQLVGQGVKQIGITDRLIMRPEAALSISVKGLG
ncbi:MAG: hypothetical protein LBV33_01660, partial [Lachnospiraceae bacterium]|nr:hypothetical protein [Lachnospiraceae bacterium]